ncbi:succinate dehydrogenase, cytochrome b556 subunit [Candidatus Pantoea edessiphila]|uniref:Succinate dehydrogenase cytochrome b556 subunit n=1 Tax=Candidatus Pantoea edessiphila TaxID=2044610 RepID=A0A2P5T297_9GAMM|nr:succinate dehydrogenase, cytochrome b556 subunit [Candidatus Pantoea edessiphila]PPI88724.1 succinate dehydrogenase, cytochrome b556 subunit [Candidatus Pantoea edessiphila]
MNKSRPINLKLSTIHFPVTAISSILHRISGIVILIVFGILLWFLNLSLSSPENFQYVISLFNSSFCKFIIWLISISLIYHITNGIRHILTDLSFLSETLGNSIISTYVIFGITIILSICAGVFIW